MQKKMNEEELKEFRIAYQIFIDDWFKQYGRVTAELGDLFIAQWNENR
jgi:hypothetical protein